MRRWCIADANVSIYGISHPLAAQSIRAVYEVLGPLVVDFGGALAISIGDDALLFEGFPVESRNAQVARLSRRLAKLHVTTLKFLEGVTLDELTGLHELLAMREEEIEAHGGVRKLLDVAGIPHIAVTSAQYVLIDEDQRVVSKEAVVVAPAGATEADADVARYVAEELLKAARDHAWWLTRFKNDPRGTAALVAEGIGKVLDGAVDPQQQQETIRSLIDNIRLVGQFLVNEQTGTLQEGHEDVQEALLQLEKEIQARARHVMSGGEASRFVNELLGVVATYEDQVKARRITQEFLKGESNLKTTERLLRQLAGRRETAEDLLVRLRDLMLREGLREEHLQRWVQRRQKPRRPAARRGLWTSACGRGLPSGSAPPYRTSTSAKA